MDLHISVHSIAPIPGTNIRECDVKVVPYDLELEHRAKLALAQCIHSNEFHHIHQRLKFCFYMCMVPSKKNVPHMLMQLFKDNILDQRIDAKLFYKQLDSSWSIITQRHILELFVQLRFFHVMHQSVSLLCVRKHHVWDIHLIQNQHEQFFSLDSALVEPKQIKFLFQNIKLFKHKLVNFLRRMISNNIGFSHNMEKIGQWLQFGQTSFEFQFAMDNHPAQYVVLRGTFDKEALLIWHFVLLNDYFKMHIFDKEIKTYVDKVGLDYIKYGVLMQIPDVWYRSVPAKYKDKFKLDT